MVYCDAVRRGLKDERYRTVLSERTRHPTHGPLRGLPVPEATVLTSTPEREVLTSMP
jgi:hypothetical protein